MSGAGTGRRQQTNTDCSFAPLEEPECVFERYPLQRVNGVPLMKPIADNWEKVANFQARPDDIFTVTYPKSGTTWMMEIEDCIMNEGDIEKTKRASIYIRCPFLEIFVPHILDGIDFANAAPSPRLIKTHLTYDLMPKSVWEQKSKVIYVARNAKDNAVSNYFFSLMCKTQPDPGTWEQYMESYLEGDVPWGSWFDHVIGWWNVKDKHNILYLFYEDMKEDLMREIRKVVHFLGKKLSEDSLERIYHQASFKTMKEVSMANASLYPETFYDQKVSPVFRKGQVSDWMNYFTESQNKRFDSEYENRMKGTDLKFRTSI